MRERLGRFWRGLFYRAEPALPLDADAQLVLHVARHLAKDRDALCTHDLMHGLLQTDAFASAIERVGGDLAAITERISLEGRDDEPRWRAFSDEEAAVREELGGQGGDAALVLTRAIGIARHRGRLASCTDLWAYLLRSNVGVEVERAGVDPLGVLFVMAHGVPEQDLSRPDAPVVHVVVRNDDYTRTELVVRVLRETFSLGEPEVVETIQAAETHGRAIVGRLETKLARERILSGRAHARSRGYPLWLGMEDC